MPKYKLNYFNIQGRGECIRFMLSYAKKDFEDNRISFGSYWEAMKETLPFGKVPVLEIDGIMYHDSAAICRYLATECGLIGDTPLENLKIDQMVGSIQDLMVEASNVWKVEGSDKMMQTERFVNERIPFYLRRFDRAIEQNDGFLVNSKLSWGDIFLTTACELLEKFFTYDSIPSFRHLASLMEKVKSLPGIKQWVDRRPRTVI